MRKSIVSAVAGVTFLLGIAACSEENKYDSSCSSGKTIVLVTHDIEFAGRYADFASFLFDGKIAASAPRRDFFAALDIYTTALSAMTGGRIISVDDAEAEE